jgi:hypothetical protein
VRHQRLIGVVIAAAAAAAVATAVAVPGSQPASGGEAAGEQEQVTRNVLATTGSCGVERWAVKTGTDADSSKINLQSTTDTTIASLRALPAPATLPASNRIAPTEDTVYRVPATLTEYKLESDSDYHLVLTDSSGNTMIAEIPDPACVGSASPLTASIQKARGEFDAKYTPTSSFKTAGAPVTVTGVGFFDYLHGQTGVAPNGIELHAVLDIQFGGGSSGCTGGGQLLANPGFETGTAAPWAAPASVISNSTGEPARSGSWDAWLDGHGTAHTDTLSQPVTLPAGCSSYALAFWLHVDTAETTTATAYDTLAVAVLDSSGNVLGTLATYSNLNHGTGYAQHTMSLAAYAGQAITIRFTGSEDYTLQTSFVIDDTSLAVS